MKYNFYFDNSPYKTIDKELNNNGYQQNTSRIVSKGPEMKYVKLFKR